MPSNASRKSAGSSKRAASTRRKPPSSAAIRDQALPPIETLDDAQDALIADDHLFYETCLDVQLKGGGFTPLVVNHAQTHLEREMDRMREETGSVRIIVPKARRMGVSTFVGARFYKHSSRTEGLNTLVTAHDDSTSQALFQMVDTFHNRCPPMFRPKTGAQSVKELSFVDLDSHYFVRTAGGRAQAGRGFTFHRFHGSEVGFWPKPEKMVTGAMEAVAKGLGTEVVLESTVDDPASYFARKCIDAREGKDEFRLVFLSWLLEPTYRDPVDPARVYSRAWLEYAKRHALDPEQLSFAYLKNRGIAQAYAADPDAPCTPFLHEFPADLDECLTSAGDELTRAIPMAWVRAAQQRWRDRQDEDHGEETAMGADIAQGGKDRSVVAKLHGNWFAPLIVLPGVMTPDGAHMAAMIIQHRRAPCRITLDGGGGWGGDTYAVLASQNIPAVLWKPADGSTWRSTRGAFRMRNKRAEAYWRFREALDPDFGEDIALPPDEELVQELCATTFTVEHNGVLLEDKDDVTERLGRSPDKADAVVLAWVMPPMSAAQVAEQSGFGAGRVTHGYSKIKKRW